MKILFRLLILTILALLGGLVFSFSVNVLIMANMIPTDSLSGAFGFEVTQRATFICMGCVALALISIFTDAKWRYFLLILPILMPSLYALLYAISLN